VAAGLKRDGNIQKHCRARKWSETEDSEQTLCSLTVVTKNSLNLHLAET
jgi:hypothetical protein